MEGSQHKRVIIFGTGRCGLEFLGQTQTARNNESMSVVGFADNDKRIHGRMLYGKYPCYPPDALVGLAYDSIVIANQWQKTREQMLRQLLDMGISRRCIAFFPSKVPHASEDPRAALAWDFAKLAREQGIAGNTAECGVNDGAFAQYINRSFFDRKLYLFDTFEGFASQDILAERELNDTNFLNGAFNRTGGWNHSVDVVMSKMMFPECVAIHKGWVPESLVGVDDTFCFVSLDMDLYQPMLAATKFFWDKISPGGLLLLHDYGHPELPGVKMAVDDFEAELGKKVAKLPMCGTLVIIKP